jgi:hypothetical protein
MLSVEPTLRALACVAFLASGTAHAQNLLTNPGLDFDLQGWNHMLYVTHVADDGWPAPGAMRFSSDFCCTQAASQCVPVVGGESYEFGAALRRGELMPGQFGDGVGMDVLWFTTSDCSGPGMPEGAELAPAVSTGWEFHLQADVSAPAAAQAALVRVRQYNFAALTGLVGFADSVVFQPSPAIVFADGFEPGSP